VNCNFHIVQSDGHSFLNITEPNSETISLVLSVIEEGKKKTGDKGKISTEEHQVLTGWLKVFESCNNVQVSSSSASLFCKNLFLCDDEFKSFIK
jgi:hypothetical protein